jgi:hypothetical protein
VSRADGMISVLERDMRNLTVILISSSALALAACDQSTSPTIAGLGGTTSAQASNPNGSPSLAVVPNRVQLAAGATFQFSTNAPQALQGQVQWSSLQTSVATISPSGLVTAVGAGTTTIVARYAFDTTRSATAIVTVTGTTATGSSASAALSGNGGL